MENYVNNSPVIISADDLFDSFRTFTHDEVRQAIWHMVSEGRINLTKDWRIVAKVSTGWRLTTIVSWGFDSCAVIVNGKNQCNHPSWDKERTIESSQVHRLMDKQNQELEEDPNCIERRSVEVAPIERWATARETKLVSGTPDLLLGVQSRLDCFRPLCCVVKG